MSDSKKEITLMQAAPWFAVALLGYMLWTKQESSPFPEPKPVAFTIEKATAGVFLTMKAESARIFSEAASKVEKGEIKTDKELFDFVQPATKLAREEATRPFDSAFEANLPRNLDGSYLGKESEVSKVLRRVAKSW